MKIKIEDIKIGHRIRQDLDDIASLKSSIEKVGLLNPILVDENKFLISGYRRLESCRQLGWTEIEATLVQTGKEAIRRLDLEYHENLGRLDLTTEDHQKYLQQRDILLRPPNQQTLILRWLRRFWQIIKKFFSRWKSG